MMQEQKNVFYSNILSKYAVDNGIELSASDAQKLTQYMINILDENKKVNLTNIKDSESFIEKHIIDSLFVLPYLPTGHFSLIDVGTGGGFPGIPIAIVDKQAHVVLMDATAKKLKSVENAAKDLGINNVVCVHSRAETAGTLPAYREHFDCAVSRAVAGLKVLVELCLPLVKVGGTLFAYKGRNFEEELSEAETTIEKLGGTLVDVHEETLKPSNVQRVIIEIRKERHTPTKYPRSFSKISKSK